MIIDEAIQLICITLTNLELDLEEEEQNALRLGIEALKLIQNYRVNPPTDLWELLPGETED